MPISPLRTTSDERWAMPRRAASAAARVVLPVPGSPITTTSVTEGRASGASPLIASSRSPLLPHCRHRTVYNVRERRRSRGDTRSVLVRINLALTSHHHPDRLEGVADGERPGVGGEHIGESAVDEGRFVRARAAHLDAVGAYRIAHHFRRD